MTHTCVNNIDKTKDMEEFSGKHVRNILFIDAPHAEHMTKERCMNTWRSVNGIQVQVGEKGFRRILNKNQIIVK